MENKSTNELDLHFGKYSWKSVIAFLVALMLIYGLAGSLFISHPYAFYTARSTALNYSRIFFIHGLTVGFAGITGLIVSQSFSLSNKIKDIIFYATIISVLVGITGGAINRSMKYKFTLWYQILSMFALDIILLCLVIGFICLKDTSFKHTKAYWVALVSSCSAFTAGLFGDLVGFIMDFGNWPGILGWYANKIGYTLSEWQDALLRTHSDMMVVSVLCLLLAIANYKYGSHLIGHAKSIRSLGEWLIIIGVIAMLAIYVVSGLGGKGMQIPHIFTEKGFFEPRGQSVAGIDLGDFVIGVFIFIGGILTTLAAAYGKHEPGFELSKKAHNTINGIFITMLTILLTVGGLGFLEEYRADLYNSDVKTTPLGDFGFIFRLLHVDVCLLLFPSMMLLMLLADYSLKEKDNFKLQILLRTGIILSFIGSLIFMVVNYRSFGPGSWVLTIGIVILVIAILYYIFKPKNSKHSF